MSNQNTKVNAPYAASIGVAYQNPGETDWKIPFDILDSNGTKVGNGLISAAPDNLPSDWHKAIDDVVEAKMQSDCGGNAGDYFSNYVGKQIAPVNVIQHKTSLG